MKRLLKILSVLTLTIVPVTSVVACGGGASGPVNPPDDDGVDIKDLLIKVQNKINEEFGNLINDGKNLFFEGQFAQGTEYYKILKNMPSDKETVIKDTDFVSSFTERIQSLVTNNVLPKLLADSDLRLLFNGISTNNILKIVNNNTKFFKVPFKWAKEDVDFGISDYSPGKYDITYWYKIRMDLSLEVSYKDAENKEQKKDFNQNYISYFANTDANISGVIEVSSLKIKEKLQTKLIEINLTKNKDISNEERIKNAKEKILGYLPNNHLNLQNAIFVDNVTTKITSDSIIPNYRIYHEANKFYNAFKLSKNESVKYLEDYFGKRIMKNFDKKLDDWINSPDLNEASKKSIRTNKENINAFGKIELNDWNISGLTLKSIKLNFINIRADETKTQWVKFMSNALGNTFSIDSWLKTPFNIINNNQNLVMYMDKKDFETYVQQNKNLYDVSEYFNAKIKAKAISETAIINNTPFRIYLNGCYNPVATLTNSEFVTKIDDATFKVNKNPSEWYSYINISIDGFRFIFGGKKDKGNYITFNNWIIKKADSTIWN
ncbi:hypothetical protein [Spiroplasma endosymbiont of Nebria brevicollis]|uniref:hypothetical protein n=1 Tax=Spiroplasma endosymbiont of Nebria brevicollis TaxID=3066284 RepID=UPI00313AD51F